MKKEGKRDIEEAKREKNTRDKKPACEVRDGDGRVKG